MKRDVLRRARGEIERAAGNNLDWVTFATTVSDAIRRVVPFERACWHPVDPGTFLFTGGLGQNIVCSGPWLAEYEYLIDDVNKWPMLARSGQRAGSLSEATHGDLTRSARTRSSAELGMPVGDELRVSLVVDGTCWAAAGFLRDAGGSWFTHDEVRSSPPCRPSSPKGFAKPRCSRSCAGPIATVSFPRCSVRWSRKRRASNPHRIPIKSTEVRRHHVSRPCELCRPDRSRTCTAGDALGPIAVRATGCQRCAPNHGNRRQSDPDRRLRDHDQRPVRIAAGERYRRAAAVGGRGVAGIPSPPAPLGLTPTE